MVKMNTNIKKENELKNIVKIVLKTLDILMKMGMNIGKQENYKNF